MYVISDHHFGHENIIEYCDRPFRDVHEMNTTMIRLWNEVVSDDIVIHLGDLELSDLPPSEWLDKLNGIIVFVQGNHDDFGFDSFLIGDVLFSHRPKDYGGWNIHGHTHNDTPFIDFDEKRVNVSVERLGYKPIRLYEIFEEIM